MIRSMFVALIGAAAFAIGAAAPAPARAQADFAPEGYGDFCLSGWQTEVRIDTARRWLWVSDYCADAGGYAAVTTYFPAPTPPPPPPPPPRPKT